MAHPFSPNDWRQCAALQCVFSVFRRGLLLTERRGAPIFGCARAIGVDFGASSSVWNDQLCKCTKGVAQQPIACLGGGGDARVTAGIPLVPNRNCHTPDTRISQPMKSTRVGR